MTTTLRAVLGSLALVVLLGACGSADTADTAASVDAAGTDLAATDTTDTNTTTGTSGVATPGAEQATGSPTDADDAAHTSGAFGSVACDALERFASTANDVDGVSFDEPEEVRVSFERLHEEMLALRGVAPNDTFASAMDEILASWVPFKDLLADADYDFWAVDPDRMAELLEETDLMSDTGEFMRRAEVIAHYAADECDLAPSLLAALRSEDEAEALEANPGRDFSDRLVDTGASLTFDFDGESYTMTDGFCGVGVDGVLVGSFTDGTVEVSFLGDTTGERPEINTFTMTTEGSARASMVEMSFDDGLDGGTFSSSRVNGAYRCS